MVYKDGLKVHVTIEIIGVNGYTEKAIHNASLTTTGPTTIKDAIEEAKALASKCINATREASERSAAARVKAESPEAKDEDAIL